VLPGALSVVEMGQDALDHRRIFDAGNELHLPAADLAGLHLNLEDALQPLCLTLMAAWRVAGGPSALTA